MLAIPGILAGYEYSDQAFTGVTVTDGRGAPRSGDYADLSDEELWHVRLEEQRHAAVIGHYHAQFQLNYSSAQVKSPQREAVIADLMIIIQACQPQIIYTHNLADKHDTHVAVGLSVIEALTPDGRRCSGDHTVWQRTLARPRLAAGCSESRPGRLQPPQIAISLTSGFHLPNRRRQTL